MTSRVPCTPYTSPNRKLRDTNFENCDSFCSATFSKTHCSFCKCRACSFCRAPTTTLRNSGATQLSEQAERRARGRELNASWCDAALMHPSSTHLFRRMWAAESWAPMEPGKPACWERRRDAPHRRLKPEVYFEQAENGTFCKTNWYEGHAGRLGQPELLPDYDAFAPALLGYDDGIFDKCSAMVGASRHDASSPCRRDKPGHVARCCLAAGYNILNMVGHRVPYNLCRNLEWMLCAVSGKLPGQQPRDRSIRLANSPKLLDVDPLKHRRAGGAGRQPFTRRCDAPSSEGGKRPLGYSLPDIFHLEVCIFNQICTNGHKLFALNVGEPFVCDFSHERFAALAAQLLRTPEYPKCSNELR